MGRLEELERAVRRLQNMQGVNDVMVHSDDGGITIVGADRPYEPELLPDDLRHGGAQIDSNDGSGAYTVTQRVWNPDAGPAAWEDGVAPAFYVSKAARDYQNRDLGAVDQNVRFWEQWAKDGTLEVLIDVSGLPAGTGQYKVLQLDGSAVPTWDWARAH